MKLFSGTLLFTFALLAIVLAGSVDAATYYSHPRYEGDYYRSSVSFHDGRGFGWDNTYAGEDFAHHSAGYIERGPYKCIGSGCGATYYLHDSHGYYGSFSGQYYNSKTYRHTYYLPGYAQSGCSGYWRGYCDNARFGGYYGNSYYQHSYNNW